ncbi:hypothetical protein MGSAQ_003245, partial [marine sediment metagenome]
MGRHREKKESDKNVHLDLMVQKVRLVLAEEAPREDQAHLLQLRTVQK